MKSIQVRLFGVFEQYSKEGFLTVEMPESSTVKDVKDKLSKSIRPQNAEHANLVYSSALATFQGSDSSVLTSEHLILNEKSLALLPPICGG